MKFMESRIILYVIEDDPELRAVIKRILSPHYIDMVFFDNATEFLMNIPENDNALLLIDYNLKDMSGKDLVLNLQASNRKIPFLIITGYSEQKIAIELMKLGAYDFVIKDYNLVSMLPSVIKSSIDRFKTELKLNETENEILKNEQKYRTIIENASDGIFIFDAPGNCIDVNQTGCLMLGYTIDEMLRKHITELIPEEDLKEILSEIIYTEDEIPKLKKTYIKERRMKRKDGSYFFVEVSTKVMSSYTIGIVRDITLRKMNEELLANINKELERLVSERTSQLEITMNELRAEIDVRKRIESELIKAKDEINKAYEAEKHLNQLKTSFISMISHEYRTPLTIINTSSYLLEKSLSSIQLDKGKQHLDKIQSSVKSMTRLLENVLIIDKIERTKGNVYMESFDIDKLVARIVSDLNGNGSRIEFSNMCGTSKIVSNITLFTYILQNLLSNSIKYSGGTDKVIVNLDCKQGLIILTIVDTGIGIPPEEINNELFEPFHRAHNTSTISGTGLGLAIVRKSIDCLEGNIKIDSVLGSGTKVTVEIPLKNGK
jgi:PAS domain S-box-containing protein